MTIKTGIDKIMKEIGLLRMLKHENVLTLHEIINDDANDKLYLSKFFDKSFGSLRKRRSDDLARGLPSLHALHGPRILLGIRNPDAFGRHDSGPPVLAFARHYAPRHQALKYFRHSRPPLQDWRFRSRFLVGRYQKRHP